MSRVTVEGLTIDDVNEDKFWAHGILAEQSCGFWTLFIR